MRTELRFGKKIFGVTVKDNRQSLSIQACTPSLTVPPPYRNDMKNVWPGKNTSPRLTASQHVY